MEHEGIIRLAIFVTVLIGVALGERWFPRRKRTQPTRTRWLTNFGLVALDTIVIRFFFPLAAVGFAWQAQQLHWGLLNNIDIPYWLAVVAGAVVLDLIIYFQHVLFHAVPALWRLHMVHHTDLDYDLTTGIRFHPVEVLLSMVIKIASIAALGPPMLAVLIFEIVLNAAAMFNHSNMRLVSRLDLALRYFIVTPDMHRVHHSWLRKETNSNYGFNLAWWDRLFGTYREQPEAGHEGMTIGLEHIRDPNHLSLGKLLILPWRAQVGRYPINRDQ